MEDATSAKGSLSRPSVTVVFQPARYQAAACSGVLVVATVLEASPNLVSVFAYDYNTTKNSFLLRKDVLLLACTRSMLRPVCVQAQSKRCVFLIFR